MGSITLTVTGSSVSATADPPPDSGDAWSWEWKPHGARDAKVIAGARTRTLTDPAHYAGSEVRAILTRESGDKDMSPFEVVPESGSDSSSTPLQFPIIFAVVAALVLAAISIALGATARVVDRLKENTAAESTIEALPGQMAWPLLVIGWVVLLVGVWMVLVEWKVGFKKPKSPDPDTKTKEVAEIIKAIADLKGATLLTVVGLVIILAPAWIAASAAESDGSSADDSAVTTGP